MDQFESLGLKSGIWEGILRRETAPARLVLVHMGARVGDARSTPQADGSWRVAAAIPSQRLSDGVQSFLLMEDQGEDSQPLQPGAMHLASLDIVAGRPLEEDTRAEMNLMRGEIDLLKRELRRIATKLNG
ncbi:hypothetical protein [Paracoccus aestuariivivens]|uniref:Uncharacterized protein n=1 Tax=Paracoccus aestuariivivens TaxID=1820333 RepID=A0A6L6JBZ8_9RHOB|nr:hypothetical protein [Paracoccus aestuariivivens]MTH78996.1 hypothetical protein [Paracoccus aestuariivivens]